ncbi:MAG: N-(5'-phosphoribosyl)anthranilate isomerase [Pyrinomonadaceae bacterium]
MTKVKICGITNLEDARLSVEFGADMIGFNFFAGSKRFVDAEYAESIAERLVTPVTKVGVFVNQSIEDILDAEGIVELDVIQLHGNESSDFVSELRTKSFAKIIKVFRVGPNFRTVEIDDYAVDAIMLDSCSNTEFGGTGETFDWRLAAEVATVAKDFYLAGGLNSANVAEAIRLVKPYAVDVASGVESSPGKKDPKKVEAFIKNVKSA